MDSDVLAPRERAGRQAVAQPTDVSDPSYFHKVVDCLWACPTYTPVPECIRKIAAGDYDSAYIINSGRRMCSQAFWDAHATVLANTCRRGWLEEQPVAICRLKRVAADHKQDIAALLLGAAVKQNGKRVACVGAGPASLTVAAVSYEVVVFDSDTRAGGMMRSQIPKFRLPDEEVGYAFRWAADSSPSVASTVAEV